MTKETTTHTRVISPWRGLFGFLGFLPLVIGGSGLAYTFLMYFGLYFEGKMSGTLKDERYIANKLKAESYAGDIIFIGVIIVVMIIHQGFFITEMKQVVAILSIICGVYQILTKAILYMLETVE